MQQPVPQGPPVAAQIVITLLTDGRLGCQAAGGNPLLILGMLEKAKADLLADFARQAEGPGIEVPHPGIVNRLNGKG